METNAVRQLERLGIPHELRDYVVDPDDLSAGSVAAKVNMPAEQVFKTLVVRGDRNGVWLAVVPGDCELDLKALARLTGVRKIEPVAIKELQPLTGYIRGGVTALGCRNYPVYLDDSACSTPRSPSEPASGHTDRPTHPRTIHMSPGRSRQPSASQRSWNRGLLAACESVLGGGMHESALRQSANQASTGASPDGELPSQFCSDWPAPPFLDLTTH